MMTYWLYYNDQPINAVRLPAGSTDDQVRAKAIDWHERVPLCGPRIAPFEFTVMLQYSEVRTFEGEL